MVIRHNMLAMNANRQFNITNKKKAKATERLSSGYKINRSADDAAGLAISEKMRRQIRGLHQAADNIQDGTSYVQTAEGALNEVDDILQRMNELAVKAANGTNDDTDREYIDNEIQQLKTELDRIFDTTTFNEKKIWEPDPNYRQQIGTESRQAVKMRNTNSRIDVTNANCGVLAYGSYLINADTSGIYVSWTGYDGNTYQTETVDWDTLEANDYSFQMSDYFGANDGTNKLYDSNGNPVFNQKVAFTPEETATIDDMIACLNGTRMSSNVYSSFSGRFENADGSNLTTSMYCSGTSCYYTASYASNHNTGTASSSANARDFDAADDVYIEPADSNGNLLSASSTSGNVTSIPAAAANNDLSAARTSTDTWEMTFYMDGIGKVTAVSDLVTYSANSDYADDDYLEWWQYSTVYVNGVAQQRKASLVKVSSEYGAGTLGSVMAALTGDKGTTTPGLLSNDNGGDCDTGGYIEIRFTMTAENAFTFGDGRSSKSIGSFDLRVNVSNTDTEQDILDKINNALNSQTIFDMYSPSATNDGSNIGTATANTHMIDVPVYGGQCGIIIQAGPEAPDDILITYDALSTIYLGIDNTSVLTEADCDAALADIKAAMQVVNAQRADFGAYQNRLEHAYNNNKNIEENTQYAESQIRDTDMASTMVEYSNLNILQQAGQAMLANANSSQQAIIQLVQSL